MERGFKYLVDKYGVAEAREKFENVCRDLLQKQFGLAYTVKCEPGDDGIDVYIKEKKINSISMQIFY